MTNNIPSEKEPKRKQKMQNTLVKHQTSMRLSSESVKLAKVMASQWGLSLTDVLEIAVREKAIALGIMPPLPWR